MIYAYNFIENSMINMPSWKHRYTVLLLTEPRYFYFNEVSRHSAV